MARAIALKLQTQSALAVVVRTSGSRLLAEHVVHVRLADGDAPKAIGEKIAAALTAAGAGRSPVVVALPRTDLHWANYDLPPAPLDELPQLVLLQAQRDVVLADDGLGFDYVSLQGDVEHPHRILGVGVSPGQLERIRAICAGADLKLQRLVPEALGWVELSRRIAASGDGSAVAERGALTAFAAMAGRQAAVWAIQDDVLRLVRTVWLAAEPDEAEDLAALVGELRRTLLSLAQTTGTPAAQLPCVYVGEHAERVAKHLAAALHRPVRSVRLEELVEAPASSSPSDHPGGAPSQAELAPLAALGASLAGELASPLDLLHPHRPPAPPSKRRTYVLAGAAAACVALALAWSGYRRIASPRQVAAAANAQQATLAPSIERMAEVEAQAAAVDAWLNASGNLLTELDYLGQQLRPKPLSDPAFNSGEDLIITKLTVAGRQFTLDAAARTTDAVAMVERRLRDGNYNFVRRVVEDAGDATPGYAARLSELVQRVGTGAPPLAAPGAAPPGASAAAAATTPPSGSAAPATTPASNLPAAGSAPATSPPAATGSGAAEQPATATPGAAAPAVESTTTEPAAAPYSAPPTIYGTAPAPMPVSGVGPGAAPPIEQPMLAPTAAPTDAYPAAGGSP